MRPAFFPVFLLLAITAPANAQTDEAPSQELTESEIAEEEAIAEDTDGSLDDASNSIDVRKVLDGFSLTSDIRVAYAGSETDQRDGTSESDDILRARWRLRTEIGMAPYLRGVVRVAGICSTEECDPNPVLEDSIPTSNSIADGDITLDEAYLHWFRLDRFDLALGRMQTKFVARGGV